MPHTLLPQLVTSVGSRTLLAAALCFSAVGASAFDLNTAMTQPAKAHSATQTMTSGRDSFTTQLYREGQKLRMDINEQGQSVSVVMRMDKETNYMLMHEMNMYQEVKSKRIKQYQSNMGVEFSNQQKLGRETVNGIQTTKYSADYKDNDGQTGTGVYWVTDDEIVIKGEMQLQRRRKTIETTWELTDLKIADQPDELFEVPAGYNSLGLGGLFSNAMKQSRQNDRPKSDQEMAAEAANDSGSEQTSDQAEEPAEDGRNVRKALGKLFRRGGG